MTASTAHCSCCRREVANTYWTVMSPRGVNVHLCAACGCHVDLQSDGSLLYPEACPLAGKQTALRLV